MGHVLGDLVKKPGYHGLGHGFLELLEKPGGKAEIAGGELLHPILAEGVNQPWAAYPMPLLGCKNQSFDLQIGQMMANRDGVDPHGFCQIIDGPIRCAEKGM